MFRRDYVLRLVERLVQALTRVRDQTDAGDYAAAGESLDSAFLELMGAGADEICRHSDTELLARLTQEGPTQSLPDKTRLLVALLQQAGVLYAAENRELQSRACWLKALNLLLTLQMDDPDSELAQFIPTIDLLRDQLREGPIPPSTLAALWRHYERIGAYARAEDILFILLEEQPDNPALISEAKLFYERLLRQSDTALEEGNLPREEVKEGFAEIPETVVPQTGGN